MSLNLQSTSLNSFTTLYHTEPSTNPCPYPSSPSPALSSIHAKAHHFNRILARIDPDLLRGRVVATPNTILVYR